MSTSTLNWLGLVTYGSTNKRWLSQMPRVPSVPVSCVLCICCSLRNAHCQGSDFTAHLFSKWIVQVDLFLEETDFCYLHANCPSWFQSGAWDSAFTGADQVLNLPALYNSNPVCGQLELVLSLFYRKCQVRNCHPEGSNFPFIQCV